MLRLPKGKERLRGSVARAYEGRCGNCHAKLDEQDRYCKFCGTERGKGRFEPFSNNMLAVYGPPIIKRYQCQRCMAKWDIMVMGSKQSKYCPKCGEKTPYLIEEEYFDFGGNLREMNNPDTEDDEK